MLGGMFNVAILLTTRGPHPKRARTLFLVITRSILIFAFVMPRVLTALSRSKRLETLPRHLSSALANRP